MNLETKIVRTIAALTFPIRFVFIWIASVIDRIGCCFNYHVWKHRDYKKINMIDLKCEACNVTLSYLRIRRILENHNRK